MHNLVAVVEILAGADGRKASPGQSCLADIAAPPTSVRKTGFEPSWLSGGKYPSLLYRKDNRKVGCKSKTQCTLNSTLYILLALSL